MIDGPHLLAAIEEDPSGLPGNVFATDVLAVAGAKKRKRSEFALAIDRQGVSIYDVRSSKLITTYAVSPQAVFTCPPCSIRSHRRGNEPARRYTYCSVTSFRPRLNCFSESSNGEITTTSINLSKEAAPVVYLDIFETGSGNKLLALHEDGKVTGYSDDLKTEEWHSSINAGVSTLNPAPAIQTAAIVGVQQACTTILKGREDVLATLGTDEYEVERSLLLVMTRSPTKHANGNSGTLELRLFHIKSTDSGNSGVILGTGQKIQPIATLDIPEPSILISKKARITMHTASGTVYQEADGALAVYDLNGSVPRLVHTVVGKDVSSYLRVTSQLVASSRGDSFSVIDLAYDSLQDEGPLRVDHEAKVTQRLSKPKDKPEDILTTTDDVRLLSYFAPLGIMIALDGRRLLAVQISITRTVGTSRKRKRESLLVNSIGRGSSSTTKVVPSSGESARKIKSLGTFLPSSESEDWNARKAALDRCIAQKNEKEFERLTAAALGMKVAEEDKGASATGGRTHINQHTVSYVLTAMFSIDQTHLDADPPDHYPKRLSIRFYPRTIGDWLIDKGLLTLSRIETSLKQCGTLPPTSRLATGSLVQAFAKLDSSLEILLSILASPISLSSQEVVHVLAIVTQIPNIKGTEVQRLLTNGEGESDSRNVERLQLVNKKTTQCSRSPSPSCRATDSNTRLLNIAMKRLYACPSSSIARALKRELSTPQLRILVDILRMEMARSGWLSPYEDSLESPDPNLRNDTQMCYIAHLLNCVIDSLGTGGWILGNSISDDLTETADTIAYMKAEISAALEGIEEATYLKGILGEMLLCGKDSLNASLNHSRSIEAQLPALPAKPETIALDDRRSHLLPLGLKPAQFVSTTKVGAGGELMKRSMRDIGRLKSRKVGKYSFDRIMI